jgi:hypothetical protein
VWCRTRCVGELSQSYGRGVLRVRIILYLLDGGLYGGRVVEGSDNLTIHLAGTNLTVVLRGGI